MHWISPASRLCACVLVCVYAGLCIHPCVHINALVYIFARSIVIWAFRHVFVCSITLKMAGACVWVDVNVREWAFASAILCVRLCESYILIWFSKASLSMFTLTSLWWVFPSGQGKKKYPTWIRAKAHGNKQSFRVTSIATPQTTPSWWMTTGRENNFFAFRLQWLANPKIHQTPFNISPAMLKCNTVWIHEQSIQEISHKGYHTINNMYVSIH